MYLDRITELMVEREKGYNQAQIVLNRDGKEVDEIVEELLGEIKNNPPLGPLPYV
jgi:shikimate kinase